MDKDMVKALAMAISRADTILYRWLLWIGYKLDTWMDTHAIMHGYFR